MLRLALLVVGIVGVAMLFLCIGIIISGRFRSEHVGHNKALRKHGIGCVQSMDAMERKTDPHRVTKMERKNI